MAEPKRTDFEIERDREEIGRLYLRGTTQQAISNYLNDKYYKDNPLSRQMVTYDIRVIVARWVKASVNHIDQRKAIELSKVDHLEITYWEAWEKSNLNAESETTEEIQTLDPQGLAGLVPQRIKKNKRVAGQSGNPAFLQGVQWCIGKRCEILGLDAPKKTDLTTAGESLNKNGQGIDRALSTFAIAIGTILSGQDAKPTGDLAATESPSVASPTE